MGDTRRETAAAASPESLAPGKLHRLPSPETRALVEALAGMTLADIRRLDREKVSE
jgi:hypothetical protein